MMMIDSDEYIINQDLRLIKLKTSSRITRGAIIISRIWGLIRTCCTLKNKKIVIASAKKKPRRLLRSKKLVKKKLAKKLEARNGK